MANEEDDGGSPPTGSPPPVRRNALEEELGALLTSSESLQDQTRAANKDLLRMKRRSREISGEIEGMILQFEQASRLWASLGGLAGGDPKDLSDAALREAFDGIDADKSGKIDKKDDGVDAVRAVATPNSEDEGRTYALGHDGVKSEENGPIK